MPEFPFDLIRRIPSIDTPWLPYGLIKDSHFRVLQVDEKDNVVVLNFKMPPGTITPMHGHHCVAMAYTLDGEWCYDDLVFKKGDIAFETTVEVHQPITRDNHAELLTIFFGGKGNDKLIEDHNEDGTRTLLKTGFFKAVERISLAEFKKLDFAKLLAS